jgi:hypothetical protein
MLVVNSIEMVIFHYKNGKHGAWAKQKDGPGVVYGNYNRTEWNPCENILDPLQYTEALELSESVPALKKALEQVALLYKLSNDNGNRKT